MQTYEIIPPTDQEIEQAQVDLGFQFSQEYITLIKSGYDMGDSLLEVLEINAQVLYLDIGHVMQEARTYYGLPEDLLPICSDNSDYYCLNHRGEVVFWSHNGSTDEKWPDVAAWREAMIMERQQ